MTKRRILLQLDSDRHPSSFDRVVAIDAGVEELFAYGGVAPEDVEGLVHGAMFTRGPADLRHTAIFVGGKDCPKAEALLDAVRRTFFGPLRTSVMLDPNGANTTAAAIVLCAGKHVELQGAGALVLGATGPVGMRAGLLLARQGVDVCVVSRGLDRAEETCRRIVDRAAAGSERVGKVLAADANSLVANDLPMDKFDMVIAAGAAGVRLLDRSWLASRSDIKVVIDANAVPPAGIQGVEAMDKAKAVDGILQYGALGVGGYKMKIHKAALAGLFDANDRIYDAEAIFDLAAQLSLA